MGKLITLSDAAKKLGVDRQSVSNWVSRGIIKAKKMAKKGSGHWVDEATIDAMLDDAHDVVVAEKYIKEKRTELSILQKTLDKKVLRMRQDIMGCGRLGILLSNKHFYESLPQIYYTLGLINDREKNVLISIISGVSMEDVASQYCITKARINQIFLKAIRKSKYMMEIPRKMLELENTKFALKEAQQTIEALTKELKFYVDKEEKEIDEQELRELVHKNEELVRLFNTELFEFDLSVRSLNCLRYANIRTVGDLVQYAKADLMKFRNFGKRSLTEIEDFLEEHNLTFSMDVKKLYNDKVQLLIKEMQG